MNGVKLLLFGIAVILFAGFGAVVEAVGNFFATRFFWVMLLGLVICVVGLLTDDSGSRGEATPGNGADEEGPSDRDGSNGDADEADGDAEQDSRYLPPNRFPPM